jgi:predicted nucleic acid-binding protein
VIAVDTNILMFAHREDSSFHGAAASSIATLAVGRGAWDISWSCIHEFLAVVTHPRTYDPPTPLANARNPLVDSTP